jgi:endonuclease/exonuclease/phosphatase family metal-dependent hydrolase
MNADVYLLQEVTEDEFVHLKSHHDVYRWFFQPHKFNYWKESSNHRKNGNVIGIRKSLNMKSLFQHSLRLSNGNRGIRVDGILNNKSISFSSIHLDDTKDMCRSMQIRNLINLLKKIKTPIIIGGDLNDETGDMIKLFKKHDYTTSPSKPTYFEESPMCLDYILVKNHIDIEPFFYIPPSSKQMIIKKFGSDHLPVTTIVDV